MSDTEKKTMPFHVTISAHPDHAEIVDEQGFAPVDTPAEGVFAVITTGDGHAQTAINHASPDTVAEAIRNSGEFGKRVIAALVGGVIMDAVYPPHRSPISDIMGKLSGGIPMGGGSLAAALAKLREEAEGRPPMPSPFDLFGGIFGGCPDLDDEDDEDEEDDTPTTM